MATQDGMRLRCPLKFELLYTTLAYQCKEGGFQLPLGPEIGAPDNTLWRCLLVVIVIDRLNRIGIQTESGSSGQEGRRDQWVDFRAGEG